MPILLAVAVAAALGATQGQAPESRQIKLASPGLTTVNLAKDRADFFGDHFAQHLNERGVRVITAKEVNAVLGLARSQQLLGCDEASTSCMTELADALGVDGVISGSIGLFGPTYQANLVIVGNGDGRLLSSVTVKADSEQQMLDNLAVGARQAASEVGAKLGKPARRYTSQAVYTDALALVGGNLNLAFARALSPKWSLVGAFELGLDQQNALTPGLGLTAAGMGGQIRYHFFDLPPHGLYLGAGVAFLTGYGVNETQEGVYAVGFSAFGLTAVVGYAIALFDFLYLSVGLNGVLGGMHMVLSGFGTFSGYVPLVNGGISTGLGLSF